jgi:hypothetical protein
MNVSFEDNVLIAYGFEISAVYCQYFATREEYQDAALLSFGDRRRCVSNGIGILSNNNAQRPKYSGGYYAAHPNISMRCARLRHPANLGAARLPRAPAPARLHKIQANDCAGVGSLGG